MRRRRIGVLETSSYNAVHRIHYAECQRNHAAHVRGSVLDGCQEFMASRGAEGSEAALTCAVCGCHRNYHRAIEIRYSPTVADS